MKNYKDQFIKANKKGITPFIMVNYILPIQNNIRKCTMMFEEESDGDISELLIDGGYEDIKIFTILSPDGMMVFFYKDKSIEMRLNHLESLMENNKYANCFIETGEILGYPKCCIISGLKSRKKSDLLYWEKKCAQRLRNSSKNCCVYFEFYPCTVGCRRAMKIKHRLRERLKKVDPFLLEIFNSILLPVNRLAILNTVNHIPEIWAEMISILIWDKLETKLIL